jgi:hypothetical protein
MSDKHFRSLARWPRGLAYAIAAVVAGIVVGELAAMLIFAGSTDRTLDEEAARSATAAPAVVAATNDLDRARQTRSTLDDAVAEAGRQRDQALIIARCEFSAAPQCPRTRITGVPGAGPEHRTADEFLADTQRDLERVTSERDRLAPALDARIADGERALTAARDAAIAGADRGFGARWLAMNAHTLASPGAMVLRAVTVSVFVVVFLVPLVRRLAREKTLAARRATAAAERERADLEADTAIALKRAEVRATVATMWAEQELASTQMAVAAQAEIDREAQRRRVEAALEAPTPVSAERIPETTAEPPAQLEAAPTTAPAADRVPAVRESRPVKRSVLPSVPDVAGAALRWVRPFVPPIVATAIETTTKPLRTAREVFEETEEIHLSLRRSHRVAVTSEESVEPAEATAVAGERWVTATRVAPVAQAAPSSAELSKQQSYRAIRGEDGRRPLPPSED